MSFINNVINWFKDKKQYRLSATNIFSIARESYDYWKSVGATDVQAYALLGNEEGETSFNFKAVGDHGEAHGIFQWHSDRIKAIKAAIGVDIADVNCSHSDMLKGAYWEMNHGIGYRHVWDNLMKTTTVQDAVTVLVHDYEHSASQIRDVERRTQDAEKWSKIFPVTNTNPVSAVIPVSDFK